MEFIINGYTVEIKAKKDESKFNKTETMEIANYLLLLMHEASENYERNGFHILSELVKEDSSSLCMQLVLEKFYK